MTMRPFTRLASTALTMMEDNVDTDVIYPARFLLIMEKQGLGRLLFHDRRVTPDGQLRADSPIDSPGRAKSAILITGANFGSGSSREQAVWALADFGISCVIAPSFGEIFHANCFNSGVLPITLPRATVDDLARRAETRATFAVDLEAQAISVGDDAPIPFDIDPGRREALMRGWDAIDVIIQDERDAIDRFETVHAARQPWLFA